MASAPSSWTPKATGWRCIRSDSRTDCQSVLLLTAHWQRSLWNKRTRPAKERFMIRSIRSIHTPLCSIPRRLHGSNSRDSIHSVHSHSVFRTFRPLPWITWIESRARTSSGEVRVGVRDDMVCIAHPDTQTHTDLPLAGSHRGTPASHHESTNLDLKPLSKNFCLIESDVRLCGLGGK
jgi:hypothetical protein